MVGLYFGTLYYYLDLLISRLPLLLKFRPDDPDYPIELEYTWNRQVIRKTTNILVKFADWNQKGNQGRGEIRPSHGAEYKRLNQLLVSRVDRIDAQLAEYNEKHPNQITVEVINGFLSDKPLTRKDQRCRSLL